MADPPRIPRSPDRNVRKDMPVVLWTGSWGTASVQQALDAHDLGQFLQSAQLAESVQRDDRVATALNTRCKGLLGLPREITPSPLGDRDKATQAAKDLETLWGEAGLTEALIQLLRWQVLMGFALAELEWTGNSESWRFTLKLWHPQFLWFNWASRRFVLNTAEGPVEITPGDGKWFLFAPEGDYRAWIQGAIRSIAIPWLGRQYAFRDWMRFNETYGLGIRKAIYPAQTPEADRDGFLSDIAGAGSSAVVGCPQGIDGEGYDIELVEASATGWETFKNATEDADKRITLALLGQNLTTEVQGGSLAAAKVHGQVRQDYLEADERGLVAGFRRQVLRAWAAFNHGDPDLAPVVRFDVEPPDDEKAKANTLVQLSTALLNLAQVAPEVDRRALLARYNLPLHEPGEEPPPLVLPQAGAPAGTQAQPLPPELQGAATTTSRGHAHTLAAVRPPPQAKAAQGYVEDVASIARDRAAKALRPQVASLLATINAAASYDDLRIALHQAATTLDSTELAELTEQALVLSQLAGRHSIASLPGDDHDHP